MPVSRPCRAPCLLLLGALALGGSPGAAQERGAESAVDRGEDRAFAIARASIAHVAAQPRFGFRWFVSYDEVLAGREKLTFVISGENVMDRAAGFLSHTERADGERDYYYDGALFTIAAPDEDFYADMPFEGGFDALVETVRERTGTVLPIWSMMSETLPERLFEETEGAAYLGVTRIAGQEAHHLAFTTYEEDWQLWVSTDEAAPWPLMLIGTETSLQGWPQYRVYFHDWTAAPEIDPAAFVFAPDEDDIRVALPSPGPRSESRLSAGGGLEAQEGAAD
ncbi:MAG: DUF2092 domain-containing protein, partial [Pseudomonadota bacterium]